MPGRLSGARQLEPILDGGKISSGTPQLRRASYLTGEVKRHKQTFRHAEAVAERVATGIQRSLNL